MTDIKKLQAQLQIDEGVKYEVYLDSLGYPTVGIGHLLTKNDPELQQWQLAIKSNPKAKITISEKRCAELFEKDCQIVIAGARKSFPDFDSLPEEVQQIIMNMMFNLGIAGFMKLTGLVAALRARNYKLAAKKMAGYLWAKQVGLRATRLIKRMDDVANQTLCNV